MKRLNWQVAFGISLVALSTFLYLLHYLIFKDLHHMLFYLVEDIAFVPIEVLLVTLVIHQLLTIREKRVLLEKLNMIIGAFFSEVGTTLLTYFSDCDPRLEQIRRNLIPTNEWNEQEFSRVYRELKAYDYSIDVQTIDLNGLKTFLTGKREFVVHLLENPTLLEHEAFTELIRAVLHLTEELASRKEVTHLPDTDLQHVANDIKRAYILLVREWLEYMKYLKNNYPYLFSLAMRTNPFDENASPIVH